MPHRGSCPGPVSGDEWRLLQLPVPSFSRRDYVERTRFPMRDESGSQRRYLTDEQLDAYRRDGYVALTGISDAQRVEELRAVTKRFVDRSRAISASDGLFDLDPRHSAQTPTLRR